MIAEEVKWSKKHNQDRDRSGNKRNFGSLGSTGRFQKRPSLDEPSRVVRPVVDNQPQRCARCGKFHLSECWKSNRRCFRCGSTDHRVRDCPQERGGAGPVGQGYAQPGRGGQQPQRGRGPARGGNSFGRGHGTPGRARSREDGDAPDVIIGTFLIYGLPYTALIDIGSTHSYVPSVVSETLSIDSEISSREMTIISPLGQSVVVSKLYRDVPLAVKG
ncbi:ATP-dependent zinc metalloprotease FtsH [Gossypium australe]|uniref:ATP-dependent zinc metalloprotease FtsH n=1 Tax=Gossypium australe TaxID=47621 RepID=A0A5B6WTP9_9ROSI|nr:ATP-dependent zinc metalloprotease FtsH [Gossypium australe]